MESKNKIALVTGGSRGLGKDMALNLAKNGIDVIITYNAAKKEADAVVAQLQDSKVKAAALQLSVGDSKNFVPFFQQLKTTLKDTFQAETFDFLVNNAGVGVYASFADTTEDQLDELFHVHFKAPFFLAQHALPLLNNGGRIINISSGLARFCEPGYAAYAAMKGGIEVLTRYQAKELGARGITVNTVAPGAIETDFAGGVVRDNPHVNKHIADKVALGRVGLPEDIGGVVAFLCTEPGRWVNAQRLEVSGGQSL
jgi:NAD(P)-dependent dehydrogenase (short-subunit alcohol dehydrogenase family)